MQKIVFVFSISVNLVRSLGHYASLRPVLESLFHRMLLYPPPVHRLDAIKAIRPVCAISVSDCLCVVCLSVYVAYMHVCLCMYSLYMAHVFMSICMSTCL